MSRQNGKWFQSKVVAIDSLKPHPRNAKYHPHPDAQIETLAKSAKAFGQFKNIVVWRGFTIAGNGFVEGARRAGFKEIEVKDVSRWSETKALALMAADNEISKSAPTNEDELGDIVRLILENEGEALAEVAAGDAAALDRLREGEGKEETVDPAELIDKAAELQKKWKVKRGDIWEIGKHRLMCGDSTSKEDMSSLMRKEKGATVFTDPPFGIDVVANSPRLREKKKLGSIDGSVMARVGYYAPVIGDESTESAKKHHRLAQKWAHNFIYWGGNYFSDFLPPSRGWIVWDKRNGDTTFADAELAWTSFDKSTRLYQYLWSGMRREGNRKIEGRYRFHPTQKPVGLLVKIIEDWCDAENIIDGFSGSGSTMVACEQTSRACRGMEIDAHYVSVTLERLSLLGLSPRRIDRNG